MPLGRSRRNLYLLRYSEILISESQNLNNMANATATNMEFCEDLRQIQDILLNANQSVRSFNKILFDSGNERYITEIAARLLRYLRQQNYLDEDNKVIRQHEAQLRKIVMYLFLSTDDSFLRALRQQFRVDWVFSTVAQLSKCLLLNCIWRLNLDRFLYEMVSYSPLWFSIQFLRQTVTSLNYAKPYEQIERIESLVRSIHLAIYRTDQDRCNRIYRNRFAFHAQQVEQLIEITSSLLLFVSKPDASKLHRWSRDRKHLYFGHVMNHLVSMTTACLKTFTGEPPDELPDSETLAMYDTMFEENKNSVTVWSTVPELTTATRKGMMAIHNLALDTLEIFVSKITNERRHYWFNFDLFSEFFGATVCLFTVISESGYRLTKQVWSMREYRDHRVALFLSDYAMAQTWYQPLMRKANAMDLKLLMLKIDRTTIAHEKHAYFVSFMNRAGLVFGNAEGLAFVEKHLSSVTGKQVRMMIEYDTSETISNEQLYGEDVLQDTRVKLRKLIRQIVTELEPDQFVELVEFMIKTFGRDYMRYQESNFMNEINELLLNYLQPNAERFDRKTVRLFVFQSPHTFYSTLIRLLYNMGMEHSEYYVDMAIEVFTQHGKIAIYYIAEYLEALLCDDYDSRLNAALCYMTRRMCERKLIDEEHFIEYVLLRVVKEACKNREHGALHKLLTLLAQLWTPLVLVNNPGKPNGNCRFHLPIAMGLAELIGGLRNDEYYHKEERHLVDHTYHHEKDSKPVDPIDLVTMIIELLEPTFDHLRRFISVEELQEILKKMTVEPLSTQYYLHKHIGKKATGAPCLPFAAFLYQHELQPPVDDERITTFLVQVLPQCTLREALGLARDDMLKAHLFDALATLVDTLVEKQPNSYNSLGHRLANQIHGLAKILLPTANTNEERNAWVKTLRHLFQRLPNEVWQVEAFVLQLQASYRLIHNNDDDVDLELLQSYFNQHTDNLQTNTD